MFKTRRKLSADTIARKPDSIEATMAELAASPVIAALPERLQRDLAAAAQPGFRYYTSGEYLISRPPEGDEQGMQPTFPGSLVLLGRRASVIAKWYWEKQYPTAGWLGGGDVCGLAQAMAYVPQAREMIDVVGIPTMTAMARLPTRAFHIPPAIVEKLTELDWGEGGWSGFARDLGRGSCMAMNPFFDDMLSTDRLRLGQAMEVRIAQPGDVILDWNQRDVPLGVVLVGGQVQVDRRSQTSGADLGSNVLGAGGLFTGLANEVDNQVEVRVTAVAHTHYMVLTRWAALRQMIDAVLSRRVSFTTFQKQLSDIVDWEVQLVEALLADPLFRGVDRGLLFTLLQGATSRTWRVAQPPPAPVGDIEGFCAVMSGELVGYHMRLPAKEAELAQLGLVHEPAHVFKPGELIGTYELAMGLNRAPHWRSRVPSEVFFVSRMRTWLLFRNDPVFLANVEAMRADVEQVVDWHKRTLANQWGELIHAPVQSLRAQPEVTHLAMCVSTLSILYFHPLQGQHRKALGYLTDAVAVTIAREFDERVCVLELKTGASGARRAVDLPLVDRVQGDPRDPVKHRTVHLHDADDHEVLEILYRELGKLREEGGYSYLFVIADEGVAIQGLAHVCERVVFLNTAPQPGSMEVLDRRGPFLYTTFLPEDTAEVRGSIWPPATVRLKLDLPSIDRMDGDRREIVDELWQQELRRPWPMRHLARWSRAVTNRRVGMALGGGGAWGMAHLAVLESLEYHRVPVDALSGASAGSQMATFYAALGGMEGLQTFIDHRTLWQLVFTLSVLSLEVDAWLNERYVHDMCLEEVALPCFPVTTVLNTASATPVLSGPITTALRCSGGLVPVYPSTPVSSSKGLNGTLHEGATYTDGGFTANVPTAVLRNEGCRLLLASNIVPPPAVKRTIGPLFGDNRFGRVMADLNPLRRAYDSVQAALILFFAAGTTAAQDAHTVIQAPWTSILPFDIMAGEALMEEQRSSPTLWQALDGARKAWEALKAPRVRLD